jgi:hypothetical protein
MESGTVDGNLVRFIVYDELRFEIVVPVAALLFAAVAAIPTPDPEFFDWKHGWGDEHRAGEALVAATVAAAAG